jgi:hypothetical protein
MRLEHHSRHTETTKGGEHVLVDQEMLVELREKHVEAPRPGLPADAWMGLPVFVDVCPCNAEDFRFVSF